ncbi:hypothetical protein TRFO_42993 [Tritrichomonas foetus]|uniref:Uncharacterized protein n=1 Tax=Tritrichomonas foetus TaxID=1144522 RepID=A0A1J4KTH1_9EUKA|nr:hypothetical protein TRFO_42993 [Tritrichomonas foetus]|eukprot:OHT14555.1 hypothetical protein TRFO_42993 [Tritrichomonas foetus]
MLKSLETYKMTTDEAKAYLAEHKALPQKLASIMCARASSQEQCDVFDHEIENIRKFLDVLIDELDSENKADYLKFENSANADKEAHDAYMECMKGGALGKFNMLFYDELTSVLLKLCQKKSSNEIIAASQKALHSLETQ